VPDHCYGTGRWKPAPDNAGAKAVIKATCLHTPNTNRFIDLEAWVVRENASSTYWAEEGMAHGAPRTDRYWFWAHYTPSGGYDEHDRPDLPSALNTEYEIKITHQSAGSDVWTVWQDGTKIADTQDNWTNPSNVLQTGSETSYSAAKMEGDTKVWEWRETPSSSWQSGWEQGASHAAIWSPDTYNVSWVNQYSHVHVKRNASQC
jgi:hypothetical protein